jgi:transposase InsO family protein
MIAFIDDHREVHGIEPICKVLPVAPSTYYDHAAKRRDPDKQSPRARRDAVAKSDIRRVFDANHQVYGARKVWRQLRREGEDIARCTVERLMRQMGLEGAIRGKRRRTTVVDKAAPCPLDLVNRQIASSSRRARMLCGCRTSPTSPLGLASCMSLSSSMPMPGASSAGGPAAPLTRALCSMPWNRRCTSASR